MTPNTTKTKKPQHGTLAGDPPDPQPLFARVREDLNRTLVGRGDEIDLALTAMLCRQHVLLVGAPGTAKSMIAEAIRGWIADARSTTVHCCKDTSRSFAFGPVKFSAMKADKTDRVLDGGAADVHVLVLEEVFKAGPAVLDMFLMLLNERVYKEGLVSRPAPLRLCLAVSNEWSPEGCETALAAFFDRFLLRKEVRPVRAPAQLRRLCAVPVVGAPAPAPPGVVLRDRLTLEQLDLAIGRAAQVRFSKPAEEAFYAIYAGLVAEGVEPGNRRLKQAVGACQAAAYLAGAAVVDPEHLEVLKDVLWVDPAEQPAVCAKVVRQVANPVGMAVSGLLLQAEDVVAKSPPHEAVPKLQEIAKELKKLTAGDPRVVAALADVQALVAETYDKVLGVGK